MAIDSAWNFAECTVVGTYTNSATLITVGAGQASRLPPVPFDMTWHNETTYPNAADDPAREIVRVTGVNIGTDQLTVVRGQQLTLGGKAASAKDTPGVVYKLRRTLTAKDWEDIKSAAVDVGALTIYVTEKGAKGDGVTNDRAALQAAIDAGNLIIFPPGTYMINQALTLKTNLEIRGAGIGVTTIKLLASSGAEHMLKATTAVSRVTIRDLTIEGNEANNPTALDGIYIDGSDRVALENVEVKECRRRGIGLGIAAGSTKRTTLRGCHVSSCRDSLIEIQNRNNDNVSVVVESCHLSTPGSGGASTKAGITASGRVQIDNVTIEGVAGDNYGLWLKDDEGAGAGNGAHDSHVSNVQINGSTAVGTTSEGVRCEADRCSFNNVFVDSCDRCYHVGVSATTGDDNSFVGCQSNGGDAGWYVEGDRCTMFACKVLGTPSAGIDLRSTAQDATIRDCNITGTTKVNIQAGATVHARNNVGWKTHTKLISTTYAADSAGVKNEVIAHGLDVTPLRTDCNLSQVWENSTAPTNFTNIRGPYVMDATATNIELGWQNSVNGDAGTNYRITVDVDVYP